jgi:iron(II)-dependent oxidoreductase
MAMRRSLRTLLMGGLALAGGAVWLALARHGYTTLGAATAVCALCAMGLAGGPATRVRGWWAGRGGDASARGDVAGDTPPVRAPAGWATPPRPAGEDLSLVERMIAQGRAALLLRPQIAASLTEEELLRAQQALDEAMAVVPQGPVLLRPRCADFMDEETAAKAQRLLGVEGYFLDRFCVTNRQYWEFVADGGYEQMSLWDEAIWPAVLGFIDQTGHPGPRFWAYGMYPAGQEDHPVVGVSWYEACAYARWVGKRLPTDPEWVKAGVWPVLAEGNWPVQRRFPWGDALDRRRANLWGSGHGGTIPVHALPEGASVNGIYQLVGNVWEWTSTVFGVWEPPTRRIETDLPLKSIRGGAFDTYFDSQSHCQFQSGESPLARKHNIGFRCALGFCDIVQVPGPSAERETEEHPPASGKAVTRTVSGEAGP